MMILSIEFSSPRRSVALARDGVVLSEAAEQTAERGTKAFALIEEVLAEADVPRGAVEAIAVGLGPGSYTGIRAAIAVAQGWHLAGGVKLVGVSSVEALALSAQAQGIFGRVNIVVDAQRGEFYLASWDIQPGCRTEVEPLKIVSATDLRARLASEELCIGPEMARQIFPPASMVARLASERPDFVAGESLEPVYLRETGFVKAPAPRSAD